MASQTPCCSSSTSIKPVQDYYGKTLKSSADLKTSACTVAMRPRNAIAQALDKVHETVKSRFYGCGSPIPDALDGLTVLDIGCGSGRDCFVMSQLVGPNGRVIGIDATVEQIETAQSFIPWHKDRYGYANVQLIHGRVEDLTDHDIADGSIDLVISNCVMNLVPDKPRLLKSISRLLKPEGELYFSDVFADRRIPAPFLSDPVIRGECLAGAWYEQDLRRGLNAACFLDYRVVTSKEITIQDPVISAKLGHITFMSKTVRAFKLDLEDQSEDYGQAVIYKGGLDDNMHSFTLDQDHVFQRGKVTPVSGNTADILSATRYAPYFTVIGDKSTHYGPFSYSTQKASNSPPMEASGCC